MGKIYTGNGWIIKVQGAEHPPIHVHVLHPIGKAVVFIDGTVVNSGVPARMLAFIRTEPFLITWRWVKTAKSDIHGILGQTETVRLVDCIDSKKALLF